MRKTRWMALTAAVLSIAMIFGACGGKNSSQKSETAKTSTSKSESSEKSGKLSGYLFSVDGGKIGVDMKMSDAKKILGKEDDYFEAASCAFEGQKDKTYTYADYSIQTYPSKDGKTDYVGYITFTDDLASTEEGISIGSSVDDMLKAYGDKGENSDGNYKFTKDGMHLLINTDGSKVTSITYASSTLDQ